MNDDDRQHCIPTEDFQNELPKASSNGACTEEVALRFREFQGWLDTTCKKGLFINQVNWTKTAKVRKAYTSDIDIPKFSNELLLHSSIMVFGEF